MKKIVALSAVFAALLAACGQSPSTGPSTNVTGTAISDYVNRPELQDADSQAILAKYGNDPGLLAALQEAYGVRPADLRLPSVPELGALDLATDRLNYIKRTAWGTVSNYNAQYSAYSGSTTSPYPGLNWTRDGCSTPSGLGLGYTEDFRPACNVHDFGYRNLKVYQRTDANRATTDEAFYTNMKTICAAKSWYKQPACYSAAYAYYQGVRIGGGSSF